MDRHLAARQDQQTSVSTQVNMLVIRIKYSSECMQTLVFYCFVFLLNPLAFVCLAKTDRQTKDGVSVWVGACVHACVRERKRKRETEREREKASKRKQRGLGRSSKTKC